MNNCNISLNQECTGNWVSNLNFKPKQAGPHFRKHGDEPKICRLGVSSREEYVQAAKNQVMEALFNKGFVIRDRLGTRLAFFPGENSVIPDYIISIGNFSKYKGRIATFYTANGMTAQKTVDVFRKQLRNSQFYVAFFEDGECQEGWKGLSFDRCGSIVTIDSFPENPLQEELDFLTTL